MKQTHSHEKDVAPIPAGPCPHGVWSLLAILLFYFAYLLAMQPQWMLGGEMYAEMGTNYYPHAAFGSYAQKLFTTDAGYIPMPQRLLALVASVFNAAAIPYFYTWVGSLIIALLVGTFSLPTFRPVVKSDALRLAVCLSLLIVVDFETRSFFNFTYFTVFFAAILAALAFIDRKHELPWWGWILPLLMMSKPYVLTIVPSLLLVSMLVKNWRLRWITFATCIVCAVQIHSLMFYHNDGIMGVEYQSHNSALYQKAAASLLYALGFLGEYFSGPKIYHALMKGGAPYVVVLGGGFFALLVLWIYRHGKKCNPLIWIGLSIFFFDLTINCFTLGALGWDIELKNFTPDVLIFRHLIAAYFGGILLLAGLLDEVEKLAAFEKIKKFQPGLVLFVAWFIFSGWLAQGIKLSQMPQEPMLGSSHWQAMASSINAGEDSLCVPVDPFGWFYLKNCKLLNPKVKEYQALRYEPVTEEEGGIYSLNVQIPSTVAGQAVTAIGILAKSANIQDIGVGSKAIITTKQGNKYELRGRDKLSAAGGLLFLTGAPELDPGAIEKIKLTFDTPVEVAYGTYTANEAPVILWLGPDHTVPQ